MYRIVKESLLYIQAEYSGVVKDPRFDSVEPFMLLISVEDYFVAKAENTHQYQLLNGFLVKLEQDYRERYNIFLSELESRGIVGVKVASSQFDNDWIMTEASSTYNESQIDELFEEMLQWLNQILKLCYWKTSEI